MQEFVAELERLDDCEKILTYVISFGSDHGILAFSYHYFPIFGSPIARGAFVHAEGFPREWEKAYVSEGLIRNDPVPRLTFENPPVLFWDEAIALSKDDPEAMRYFARMRSFGMGNGASFALYGPRSRNGYATMIFDKPPQELPEGLVSLMNSMVQAAHVRICQITSEDEASVELSHREREVLGWMAGGKSASEIAGILKISPDTVRTYIRRLYEKLDVTDRVAATVKGLRLGLITI